MRWLWKWFRRLILALLVLIAALWLFGSREPVETAETFDPNLIGADPVGYLAAREAAISDITKGAEARIVWAGPPNQTSDLAIVYLHGFSATSEEIRPVPDRVAETLGANLVFARLTGHGRGGDALGEAGAGDWMRDYDEAVAIADKIGERVIVISTSTGSTIAAAAEAAGRDTEIAGLAMISPNFRLANPAAMVLTFPAARQWVPALFGARRSFEPQNDAHGKWWTTEYPSTALFPMAALVRHAASADYSSVSTPALFLFADGDQVVDHRKTREIASEWGGPVALETVNPGAGDDPLHHVIAGDILSPGMNEQAIQILVDWSLGL